MPLNADINAMLRKAGVYAISHPEWQVKGQPVMYYLVEVEADGVVHQLNRVTKKWDGAMRRSGWKGTEMVYHVAQNESIFTRIDPTPK